MAKVTVEICCGTACYLLGAAKLLNLENELRPEWRDQVDIRALPCLSLCENSRLGAAPYVRLNGEEIVAAATLEKLLERIGQLLEEAGR